MSTNEFSQNNNIVPDASGASSAGIPATGQPYYDSVYPSQSVPRQKSAINSAESARMTPQILVLLIATGLKRVWKWALPMGFVLSAAAFTTMYLLFPVEYEASAWLRVLSTKPKFIFSETDTTRYENFVATQFSTIKSPLIVDKALENAELARLPVVLKEKDKRAWLAKNLRVAQQGRSEIITVSTVTEIPKDAEVIVNAIITAYLDDIAAQTQRWNTTLVNQLNSEFSRQQSAAKILQDQIRQGLEQAASLGSAAADEGLAGGLVQGESIARDMYLQESQLFALRAKEEMFREMMEGNIDLPQTVIKQAITSDPVQQALQTQLEELRARLDTQKKNLPNPADPTILGIQEEISRIERQINERLGDSGASAADVAQSSIRANLEEQRWAIQMDIRAQEIILGILQKRHQEQLSNSETRTVKTVDVSFQQEQLKRINGVLDLLQTRLVGLETEKNAPEQIQLIRKAVLPLEPKTRNRIPLASMGAAAFFCFPFLLGIAIERLKPRLYHVSQIRRGIPSVLIGEIMEPPVAWIHGPTFRKRLARYRESVHNWCTHLLLSDPFRRCKTLSVASVSGDDGKTFLAVQVAVAMAQMKSGSVLLIDADMRVGRLHLLFGNEETGIGLADVLSFRNGFGEAVVLNEREPNLHLLSAGQLDVSPYELLGDGRFRELLDTLENHYSLIIVVLPPVANAAESLMMAASTDSTLLCVRQGETVLAAMEDVYRKLTNTGSSIDAIVVKDIPYYQMAGKDGGFADKLEQIRLAHLLQYAD